MGSSRFRIEAFDSKGNKFTVSFEGRASREKVLQVLDMVELLGGLSSQTGEEERHLEEDAPTKLARVKATVLGSFGAGWFSSKDLAASFDQAYGEPLALSTASTYLQRLAFDGFLLRSGPRRARRYRLNIRPEERSAAGSQEAFRNSSLRRV